MMRFVLYTMNFMFIIGGVMAGTGFHYMIEREKSQAKIDLILNLPISALGQIPCGYKPLEPEI